MAIDYEDIRLDVEEAIEDAGFPAIVFTPALVNDDDEWGDPVADTPAVEIHGISTPIFSFKTADVDGNNIKFGDGYVYFHSEEDPEIDMQITINSITHIIRGIKQLTSGGGVNVYRRLHLRV
jgi:hypothetical protein